MLGFKLSEQFILGLCITKNQMEKNMGNETETGILGNTWEVYFSIYWGYIGIMEK